MDNENVVHAHYGILFNCEEKWTMNSANKWTELGKITLSEVTQTQKVKHKFSLMRGSGSRSSVVSTCSVVSTEIGKTLG